MKNLLLVKIRLSHYFWIFFTVFTLLSFVVPGQKYEAGVLTLFSVNSFLYGFYIAPILGAQKARIDEFHRILRAESNAMFSLMLFTKKLPEKTRNEVQGMVVDYIQAKLHRRRKKLDNGEKQYESLITYCVNYKGKDLENIDKVLAQVVANQQNRTNFTMQAKNIVFANEWHIMAILFSITLGFILTVEISEEPVFHVIRALLCTGLTMLIVILIKLNTLTHKKAKQMWDPMHKLIESNFYRID